jgi:hypothetical protein
MAIPIASERLFKRLQLHLAVVQSLQVGLKLAWKLAVVLSTVLA